MSKLYIPSTKLKITEGAAQRCHLSIKKMGWFFLADKFGDQAIPQTSKNTLQYTHSLIYDLKYLFTQWKGEESYN